MEEERRMKRDKVSVVWCSRWWLRRRKVTVVREVWLKEGGGKR